jgi:paraquat-inducible protein B
MDEIEQHSLEPRDTRQRGLSLIWLVPLMALVIGIWIAWKDWSEQGATIHISFQDVKGLEEGKSKIRYRSLDIGLITAMELAEDQRQVMVTAELKKGADRYLSRGTRFWVVRPRLGLNTVSGLETLLSGGYVEMDMIPGEADGQRDFVGLETPPAVAINQPGRRFTLFADKRGSVSIGSPLFYRNISTGIVTDVKLEHASQQVIFEVFVRAPYDQLVTNNTVFWNAGGLNMSLGADGIEVAMESLESLITGGVAFGLPKGVAAGEGVSAGQRFMLHGSERQASKQRNYESTRYVLYFNDSVRGLSVGAPVEFSGIRLGEVLSIDAEYDTTTLDFRIPVTIEIERGRFQPKGEGKAIEKVDAAVISTLIDKGLRATLKSSSLLTGSQFVDLVFLPDAEKIATSGDDKTPYAVIPTVSSGLNLLQQRITSVVARIDKLPIESIGENLDKSMGELNQALKHLNSVLEPFGKRAEPISSLVERTLKRTSQAMSSADRSLRPNSQLQGQLLKTLDDFSGASKAIRDLARFLERNPQSILLGKPGR